MQRLRPALQLPSWPGRNRPRPRLRQDLVVTGLVSALLVIAAPAGAHFLEARAVAGSAHLSPPELPRVSDWDGPEHPSADWNPNFPAADAQARATYGSEGGRIYLYQGWYAYERGDAKLLYFENRLFDRRQWRLVRDGHHDLQLDGRAFTVREQVLRAPGGGDLRVLWSWYRVDDAATANAMWAKLLNLRGVLRGRPEAMVIALATDAPDEEEARSLLRAYLAAAPDLQR
jgi:EpsI family protein